MYVVPWYPLHRQQSRRIVKYQDSPLQLVSVLVDAAAMLKYRHNQPLTTLQMTHWVLFRISYDQEYRYCRYLLGL